MEEPVLRSRLALIAIAITLGASPARAAELGTNKQCYQAEAVDRMGRPLIGEPVTYAGGPFRPFSAVTVARDGVQIDTRPVFATGFVAGRLTAPSIGGATQAPFTLTVTDSQYPSLTGTATRLASLFNVTVRPGDGPPPATRRQISARGFTSGGTLYAHMVRGRAKRNVRIGRLKGPCGDLRVKKQLFAKRAGKGTYRVQFDTARTYSNRTIPRVTFKVRVFRTSAARRGAAASAAGERWRRYR